MVTTRRTVRGKGWIRGFIVAFLAIAAAVLLTAQPVKAYASELNFDVKDEGKVKKMSIKVDDAKGSVSATVDGKPVKVNDPLPFPIVLGKNCRKIQAIYPGPVIVFEGSYCVFYNNRWIGTPPCP